MKINEKKDLQTKTKAELVKLLQEAQAMLMNLKLDHQQAKLKDTRSIFNTRKKIAILKTVLQGKPVEVAVEEKPARIATQSVAGGETKKKEDKK